MKKMFYSIVAILAICSCVNAGQLGQNANGFYFIKDNGQLATSEWVTIDIDGDGQLEYCYFNDGSALVVNAITPDGYQVNEKGCWVENGQVKKESSNNQNANNTQLTNINQNGVNIGCGIICEQIGKEIELGGGTGQLISINAREKYNDYYELYYSIIAKQVFERKSSGLPHVKGYVVCYDAYGAPCEEATFILKSTTVETTKKFLIPKQTVKIKIIPWD